MGVQGAKPLALGEPAIGPEAGDLSEGMNAGIGPARSDDREPVCAIAARASSTVAWMVGTFSWRCQPA